MTGLANWLEILLVLAGVVLLLLELLILPGFGIAGITGIICLIGGFLGMLIKNPPDRFPWPRDPLEWQVFTQGVLGLLIGIGGFGVFAFLAGRYLPRLRLLSGLVLTPPGGSDTLPLQVQAAPASGLPRPGQIGQVESTLRPIGKVRFDRLLVECSSYGQFVGPGQQVKVVDVKGTKVFVEPVDPQECGEAQG